jgi:hypothetical protein
MRSVNYDIVVAYRIYPGISKHPLVYENDKFKLSELCLRSFKDSLGNLAVKLIVLLDGCPDRFKYLFQKYFSSKDLELIELDGIGNRATFKMQMDVLLKQTDAELVYFAEDDYFYLSNQMECMVELIKQNKHIHFVFPYDHPDYYQVFANFSCHLIHGELKHWRSVFSGCLTFLTSKNVLNQTKSVFFSYCNGNHDSSVWLALTNYPFTHPIEFIRMCVKQPFYVKSFLNAFRYTCFELFFKKRRSLWAPIPSIATHLEKQGIAPVVNWQSHIKRYDFKK